MLSAHLVLDFGHTLLKGRKALLIKVVEPVKYKVKPERKRIPKCFESCLMVKLIP